MARGIARVTLVGNLTRDPELRQTPSGTSVCQLGVAVNGIGQIIVDTDQHTNVPGILAAGDVTSPHDHQFSAAVHEGNQAACAANYRLYRPEQRDPGAEDC